MEPRLNRKLKVVFQPKNKEIFNGKRRFGIGVYSLSKYIGKNNAKNALQRVFECEQDKLRVTLRKHGIIDFYFI